MPLETDKRAMLERKRNLLMLLSQYLYDHGLPQTADQLAKESLVLASARTDFQLCDNVDLDSIYLDYMSYHQAKFGRVPRITKRKDTPVADNGSGDGPAPTTDSTTTTSKKSLTATVRNRPRFKRSDPLQDVKAPPALASQPPDIADSLVVSAMSNLYTLPEAPPVDRPVLRNHPNYSAEWSALANAICRDIIDGSALPAAAWQELRGLDTAKEILHESVLTPLQYPGLFAGELRPWKCILLHGPPGTGKTSLARALCREATDRAVFFNVSASAMVSKWRGDSEKLVRVLFDVAKYFAPSIIFIDEVDGLMSRRDGAADQHEASKRFKNELLTNIDGLDQRCAHNVFVLGSTNLPWDLDPAFLRRFERKLLLGLPAAGERLQIIGDLMPRARSWPAEVRDRFATLTTRFSGDDIRIAHKVAAMQSVRHTIRQLRTAGGKTSQHASKPPEIAVEVLLEACSKHQPMAHAQLGRYVLWQQKNGGIQ